MTTAPKLHFPLSPSAAHRWLVCPGEPRLRSMVPNKTSSYAEEGTTAHWVGESCLKAKTKAACDPSYYVGHVCPETKMTVTHEMAEAVRHYVRDCVGLLAPSDWYAVESRFTLPGVSPDLGGTCDFACFQPTGSGSSGCLVVRDYKHGKGHAVDVEDNPQLKIYALGALEELQKKTKFTLEQINAVSIGICQPRIDESHPIKCTGIPIGELIAWREEVLKPAVRRVKEESEKHVAGDHCLFCPAKAVCPAISQRNLELAKIDFAAPVHNPPAPQELTIDQMQRVLLAKDQLVSWIGAIEAHLQNLLEQGTPVSYFKLVAKRSVRQWAPGAEHSVVRLLGDGAYKKSLVSPAEAEKQLKPLGLDLPAELVTKPDNGVVIAPVSDKRPAAAPSAITDFLKDSDIFQ